MLTRQINVIGTAYFFFCKSSMAGSKCMRYIIHYLLLSEVFIYLIIKSFNVCICISVYVCVCVSVCVCAFVCARACVCVLVT